MANLFGGPGDDRIIGTSTNDLIDGRDGNDYLEGGDGNNQIYGGSGNDILVSGPRGDNLYGGTGNDRYILSTFAPDQNGAYSYDRIVEDVNSGIDTVETSFPSFTLPDNVENLTFVGSGAFTGEGNSLDNDIYGGSGNDVLRGGAGNDYLSGQGGNDFLDGGTGNDLYGVASVGDTVSEAANAGIDTVNTTLSSYTLGANVENLTYPGSGNFTGVGNELNNVIRSGAGDDYLSGRGGDDYLVAGDGDDLYGVDSDGDTVVEYANGGIDTVNTTLSSYTLGANVENLTYPGSAAFRGSGNSLNNVIRGGSGLNALYGGDGNDTVIGKGSSDIIRGGSGSDVLTGGGGPDRFEFLGSAAALGRDRVTDFGTDDTLVFQTVFSTAQQVLNNARQVGADTVITLDANNSITLSNFARASLTAGDIYIVPPGGAASLAQALDVGAGFEKTFNLGSSLFDDSFGSDDAFSFDLDALIGSLAPTGTDAVKGNSGSFATVEPIEDVSVFFAQGPDAGQTVSFDFVSASHVQSLDHGAVFAIA
jgi:Ca2+-binding RTX toxin-like protein